MHKPVATHGTQEIRGQTQIMTQIYLSHLLSMRTSTIVSEDLPLNK